MTDLTRKQLMHDLWAYGFAATMDGHRIDPNDIYLTVEDAPMTNEQLAALDAEATQGVYLTREVFDFLMGAGPLEGTHFGNLDDGLPGRFWWRAILRAAEREAVNAYRAGQLVARTEPIEADVERVALAICKASWSSDGEGWQHASQEQRDEFFDMARAAIAAMVR